MCDEIETPFFPRKGGVGTVSSRAVQLSENVRLGLFLEPFYSRCGVIEIWRLVRGGGGGCLASFGVGLGWATKGRRQSFAPIEH